MHRKASATMASPRSVAAKCGELIFIISDYTRNTVGRSGRPSGFCPSVMTYVAKSGTGYFGPQRLSQGMVTAPTYLRVEHTGTGKLCITRPNWSRRKPSVHAVLEEISAAAIHNRELCISGESRPSPLAA